MTKTANKIAQQFLNRQAGGQKVIVVDVQPAYKSHIHDPESWMEYLNKAGEILCLYNGPNLGMDKKDDILDWWVDNGFDPDKQYDVIWDEKGYGFFRDWMDGGVDDDTIIAAARYMIENRIWDSRQVDHETWVEELGTDMAEEIADIFSGNTIGIPDIDLRALKRFRGASLIGGACYECLLEVKLLLDALEIPYREVRRFVYSSDHQAKKLAARYAAGPPLYVGFDLLDKFFSQQPLMDTIREARQVVVTSDSAIYKNPGVLKRSVIKVLQSMRNARGYEDINLFNVKITELPDNKISLVPTPKRIRQPRPQPSSLPLFPKEGFALKKEYPKARGVVDGRSVLGPHNVPNMDSIAASLYEYEILPGLREVPMSDFPGARNPHYSVQGSQRIEELAGQIQYSKKISPLIVVVDDEGPYVLEGNTRLKALYKIGAKSFPAVVVIDLENPPPGY